MRRRLILSLVAAASLAGCGAANRAFGPCTEYGTFDQNGDAAVESTACPEPANETDVVIPDGGSN